MRDPFSLDNTYSPGDLRIIAECLVRARRVLDAATVARAKYGEDTPEGKRELRGLLIEFNLQTQRLPLHFRTTWSLMERVAHPAARKMERVGVLALAEELDNLPEGAYNPWL